MNFGFIFLFILSSIFFTKKKVRTYCIDQEINNPTTNGDTNKITNWVFYFYKPNKSKYKNNNKIDYWFEFFFSYRHKFFFAEWTKFSVFYISLIWRLQWLLRVNSWNHFTKSWIHILISQSLYLVVSWLTVVPIRKCQNIFKVE